MTMHIRFCKNMGLVFVLFSRFGLVFVLAPHKTKLIISCIFVFAKLCLAPQYDPHYHRRGAKMVTRYISLFRVLGLRRGGL